MGLTSKLAISAVCDYTNPQDLAVGLSPLSLVKQIALASGIGAGQADRLFHDKRPINASANDDLDLAGGLVDAFGASLTFARIKGLLVAADPTNINNVVIGAAAANPWTALLGATHTLTLRPGAAKMFFAGAADATGYPVVAGTGDILRIANSGGGSAVNYEIAIIGASA